MPSDPTRVPDAAVRALARQLGELQRKVDTIEAGQRTSQLGNSSIDDGTLWATSNGVNRVGFGEMIDGKFGWFAVNGEAPPAPNAPELLPTVNGVAIVWNGQFTGPAPSDFTHVKAYLSPVGQSFIPSEGNLVGHFIGGATLPVTPLEPGINYWCVLIAYNTSDVASDPSFVAGPVSPTAVVATEILDGIVTDLKLADGAVSRAKIAVGAVGTAQIGNQQVDLSKLANGSVDATKIVDGSITPAKVTFTAQDIGSVATYNQASAPSGTVPQGSLWFDGSKLRRYAGSSWFELTDAGIANALSAAQQAQTDAANALSAAAGAEAAVDGKVTVYYQASSPSGANTGDLWLDTDDANKLYRWSGSTWVLVSDTRIATALVNAQTAQSTADGKIQAFYQATAPTGVSVGDLWFNTSAGNAVSRWNGSSWVSLPLGSGAIGSGAIGTAHIQNGAVTGTTIAGSAVDTSKLASGAVDASKIAANAVTAPAIQDGAVGSAELSANSVVAGKVAANAITAGTISAGVVGATELAANSVVAGKIAANTIGANEIISNSIVAGKLAADSVTSTNIVAGGVQTANLAAGSVSTEKLVAGSVIAEKIAALAVTADKIAANQINAGHIQAGSITADRLAAILLLASTIVAGDPNDWHLELGDPQTPILFWDNTSTGFAVSRDQTTGQSNVYMSGRVEFGNGSQIENDYLDLVEQPATGMQQPKARQSRTLIYSDAVSSVSAKWLSATGKGNLLLCSVLTAASGGAATYTVPSGWQLVGTVTGGASGSTRLSLYYIANAAASRTTETITASKAASWAVGLYEYSGIAASALDVSATASGTGTTASTGTTAATAQAVELQLAVFGTPGAASAGKSGFSAPTNGFKLLSEGGGYNNQGSAAVAKVSTGVGTVSAQATVSSSQPWLGLVATFRAALAAAVPNTPPAKVVRLYSRPVGGASTTYVQDSSGANYPVGRTPYCRARLNSPSTPSGGPGPGYYLAANTDVYAQGDWSVSADPYSMVAISTSGSTFSNITIPITGYYLIDFRTIFQASSAPGDNAIVTFVTANGRNAASNSVARDARGFQRYGVGDLSPVQAHRIVPLTAGDILYWGSWANVNCYVLNGAALPTEIAVFYLGMSA